MDVCKKRTCSIVIMFILIAIALYVSPNIIVLHKMLLLISASLVYSYTVIKWIEGDNRSVDINWIFSIPIVVYCGSYSVSNEKDNLFLSMNSMFYLSLYFFLNTLFINAYNKMLVRYF
jgi:hypothetical protein